MYKIHNYFLEATQYIKKSTYMKLFHHTLIIHVPRTNRIYQIKVSFQNVLDYCGWKCEYF